MEDRTDGDDLILKQMRYNQWKIYF
jgi:hypothetical protein